MQKKGFFNAFFNSLETGYGPLYHLHFRYGLLTSSFNNRWLRYFLTYLPWQLKNVHFTVFKPWHRDGKNRLRQITDNIQRNGINQAVQSWTDEMLTRFLVRYWLDVEIALKKCGNYCTNNQYFTFIIPDDVNRWRKYRPEPFVNGEIRVGYTPNDDTTKPLPEPETGIDIEPVF